MWKKLKSRGAETVEYAIVLACIAAFGLMFSDNLTDTLKTLMGKTNSIITNGSTDKGDQDNDAGNDDHNVAINNKNLAWLEKVFLNTAETHAKDIELFMGTYSDKKKGPDFKDTRGLIDSDSNSSFLNKIGLTDAGGLKDSSWAFAGYRNEKGELCYGVSIYSNEKNDNQSLAEKKVGTSITTDIYTVNTVTDEVKLHQANATQIVGTNNGKDTQVNAIRDPGYI